MMSNDRLLDDYPNSRIPPFRSVPSLTALDGDISFWKESLDNADVSDPDLRCDSLQIPTDENPAPPAATPAPSPPPQSATAALQSAHSNVLAAASAAAAAAAAATPANPARLNPAPRAT
eukprot:CAMPEP_0184711674 /NCGR_PEP_ID=MMETSP0314-20130426/2334_1 /TAXON_ID=38298 /ORGANISM="Rhodella maculata, Strain CCMP 736" /LENGTH=118 /DNA_ID=CAMNT_0027173899 /DNA_START=38 /DNA_END=390 /DNA_ORIENTATION=+